MSRPSVTRVVKFIRKGDKGDAAETYKLVASATAISRTFSDTDDTTTWNPTTINIKCVRVSGSSSTTLSTLPAGFYIKYSRDGGTQTEMAYSYISAGTPVSSLFQSGTYHLATFYLYDDTNQCVAATSISLNDNGKNSIAYSILASITQFKTNAGRTITQTCTCKAIRAIAGKTPAQMGTNDGCIINVIGYDDNAVWHYSGSGTNQVSFGTNSTNDGTGKYCTRFEVSLKVSGTEVANISIPVVESVHEINPNILLRTIFTDLDFVKEAWAGSFSIDEAADTVVQGRKSLRINAASVEDTYLDLRQDVYGRVKAGTWYTLSFNYFATGEFTTFIWSGNGNYSAIDQNAGCYVDGKFTSIPEDGRISWAGDWSGNRHFITFKTASSFSTSNIYIIFRAYKGTQIAICMPKLEDGIDATAYVANEDDLKGTTLRGPQDWNDCAVGYKFMKGEIGERYSDIVTYNGNYYTCKKSHNKTASNYPTSTADTNNGYWQLGDKVDLIATRILLATYALVKNLGVEAVEMKDSSGNIVFKAKDGEVTCKKGTFENVNISGILRTNLFYSKTLVVTTASAQTYIIDPSTAPAYTYFVNEPTNHRWIRLPDATTYDGLEIQVFDKDTNWDSEKSVHVGCAVSGQKLYIKKNIFVIQYTASDYYNPDYYRDKFAALEDFNAAYSTCTAPDSMMIQPNLLHRFKAMNGAWYALSGLFTGE